MKKILVCLSLLLSVAVGKTVFDDYDNAFKITKSVLPKDATCEDEGKGKRKSCKFENGRVSIRDKRVILSYSKTINGGTEPLDYELLPVWQNNCIKLAVKLGVDESGAQSMIPALIKSSLGKTSYPLYTDFKNTEILVAAMQNEMKNNHSTVKLECVFKENFKDNVSDDGWQKIN